MLSGSGLGGDPIVGIDLDITVAEDTPVGTVVATATVSGDIAGVLTFEIDGGVANGDGTDLTPDGLFSLEHQTGLIRVAAALDFETGDSYQYAIDVSLTDPVLQTTVPVTSLTLDIGIGNVNESPDLADMTVTVDENTPAGVTLATASADDPDEGQSHTYAITDGNDDGAFTIDTATGAIAATGDVTLNFERFARRELTVEVTDDGEIPLTDEAIVTLNLNDLNEQPTLRDRTVAINENLATGSRVAMVQGRDVDAGDTLSYAILSGNEAGAFALDAETGLLTVANKRLLDYETTPVFELEIRATDSGDLTTTGLLEITLNDRPERPILRERSRDLFENLGVGSPVARMQATGAAAGADLVYEITSGNTEDAFAIDPQTGRVTVANKAALNYEVRRRFALRIEVTDQATGHVGVGVLRVALQNRLERPTVLPAVTTVDEHTAAGTPLLETRIVGEADSGYQYDIIAGNELGALAIDPVTGQISVADAAALDRETASVIGVRVRATDLANTDIFGIGLARVRIRDVNEAPSIADLDLTVAAGTPNATVLGQLLATDPDLAPGLVYSILNGNEGEPVAIHAGNGKIRVRNSDALQAGDVIELTVEVRDRGDLFDTARVLITVI